MLIDSPQVAGEIKYEAPATFTSNQSVVDKAYVDGIINSLDVKNSVRVATTANINLSGLATIDGISLAVGDRVLVKNQTNQTQNGIYVVASGAWTRAVDADESLELTYGTLVNVVEGSTLARTVWILNTQDPITLGTSQLVFNQVSTPLNPGSYISITGNSVAVDVASLLTAVVGAGLSQNGSSFTVDYSALATSLAGSGLNASSGTLVLNQAVIPYDIAGQVLGKPADAAVVCRFVANRAFTLPTNLSGSSCKASTASTASAALTIKKNGTSVGTINFSSGNNTGSFTFTQTSFAAGDILTVENQATADATLADIQFTLSASLS